MKKRPKFLTRIGIIITAAIITALSLCSISASAEDSLGSSDSKAEYVADVTECTAEDNTASLTDDEESVFTLAYELLVTNADEIFSAVTFIISLALMIIYKKGMMPTLESGVRSLAAGVRGIGERASEIKDSTDAFANNIAERLASAENTLATLADSLKQLNFTLDEREKNSYSADDLTTVMLAEIDMLYEIFASAELPQYLKDRVGEKVSDMKRKLEGEKND